AVFLSAAVESVAHIGAHGVIDIPIDFGGIGVAWLFVVDLEDVILEGVVIDVLVRKHRKNGFAERVDQGRWKDVIGDRYRTAGKGSARHIDYGSLPGRIGDGLRKVAVSLESGRRTAECESRRNILLEVLEVVKEEQLVFLDRAAEIRAEVIEAVAGSFDA